MHFSDIFPLVVINDTDPELIPVAIITILVIIFMLSLFRSRNTSRLTLKRLVLNDENNLISIECKKSGFFIWVSSLFNFRDITKLVITQDELRLMQDGEITSMSLKRGIASISGGYYGRINWWLIFWLALFLTGILTMPIVAIAGLLGAIISLFIPMRIYGLKIETAGGRNIILEFRSKSMDSHKFSEIVTLIRKQVIAAQSK